MQYHRLSYLASPYTHKSLRVQNKRLKDVTIVGAILTLRGEALITPITTSAELIKYMPNIGSGFIGFWDKLDLFYISKCNHVFVLKLDGWDKSIGVTAEVEYAKALDIPITYLEPKDFGIKGYK